MKAKEKDVELQTENLRMVSEVKAQKAKLKSDLNNLELQTDTKVKPQHKQLEKEKATFSAYVKLCGHVRLDSQHTGPDVRGTVSLEPSADVTFSLDPATLSAVQLTNRLWQIAAEHVAPAKQCASQPELANQGAEPLEATNQSVERAKTPEATDRSVERAKMPEATNQDGERSMALEAGKQSVTQPSKIFEEYRPTAKRTAAPGTDSEMADPEDDDSAKENIPANCVEA
ncbi:uncharacterized protein LOC119092489 [Pollicipes pollicipes]|uniref:uncharacterized protein LOC119092489 n=1 Tax=Pollicipes pollicipes TaxID=41117 RepID=UPI001884B819|nr:uncharacterized protein LOC119092489 [Pollicipes pollicipes]